MSAREGARAKIRVMVKRILNKFGYPPDLQEEAVKTVLILAELLCANWTGHSRNPALPRPQEYHSYGPLHGVVIGSVQEILAGLADEHDRPHKSPSFGERRGFCV